MVYAWILEVYPPMSYLPSLTKRLIRHRKTGTFFKEGGWTADLDEAQAFSSVLDAVNMGRQIGPDDVELVLRFGYGGNKEMVFPIWETAVANPAF